MTNKIKQGDVVLWRGCFNTQLPIEATIESIELGSVKRSKYGNKVTSIPEELKDFCCFSLSNGHWAYGEQITTLEEVTNDYELYYT